MTDPPFWRFCQARRVDPTFLQKIPQYDPRKGFKEYEAEWKLKRTAQDDRFPRFQNEKTKQQFRGKIFFVGDQQTHMFELVLNELQISKEVSGGNERILKYFDIYLTGLGDDEVILMMEDCPLGSSMVQHSENPKKLRFRYRAYNKSGFPGEFPVSEANALFAKVLQGLDYLHENRIAHLDIKPENIFISKNGEPKIADFELSKKDPAKDIKPMGRMGTPGYMDNKICEGNGYPDAFKCDIFALGVTWYVFLVGKTWTKFKSKQEYTDDVNSKKEFDPKVPDHLRLGGSARSGQSDSNRLTTAFLESAKKAKKLIPGYQNKLRSKENDGIEIEIIRKMCDFNADNRPTTAELLKHGFIENIIEGFTTI